MFVLTRQPDERLLIGEHIVIQVREVGGNQVKIGIEAPPEVKVLREELVEPDRRWSEDGDLQMLPDD